MPARDYDLAATLDSGQTFRWHSTGNGWEGIIRNKWVRLVQSGDQIQATTCTPHSNWSWLEDYLQSSSDFDGIIASFPDDEPMQRAVRACRGLRLLKQDCWQCLGSFILSSTKQILQIRRVVATFSERFGDAIPSPHSNLPSYSFPSAETVASLTETELRACGMGFRAPYLLGAAQRVADGALAIDRLNTMSLQAARETVMTLPGVGRKIADCFLLFTGAQPCAFPVDVWITKALQRLYFPTQNKTLKQLQQFGETHFGPNAGYAQQYLFHYMRVHRRDSIN